jgi:16S rRNA (uracil1498-N3)-methyltransferase
MKTAQQKEPKIPPLFIVESLEAGQENVSLPTPEAAHAIKVRRLRVGNPIHVTNGTGLLGEAIITSVESKPESVVARLLNTVQRPAAKVRLTLATAMPKGERQSILLDMATQLGVNTFVPLDCDFSVVRFQDKMRDRWLRIIHSACKQTRQLYLPEVKPSMTVGSLLQDSDRRTLVLYGDQHGESIYQIAQGIMSSVDHILLMTGPEGGFSEAEQALLSAHPGTESLCASDLILRTETAAAALVTLAAQLKRQVS